MSLTDILAAARPAEGGFDAHIPDSWLQGRTAYGGLSAALALEAARLIDEDLPPLRSAQISYIGPLAGDVTVRAQKLRRGRNAAFVRSDVIGEVGLGLSATFVFMNALESQIHWNQAPAPDVPSVEEAGGGDRSNRNFLTNNFNWRDAIARTDPPSPDVCRWIQLEQREGLDPMVELIAIGDALPPAAALLAKGPTPLSTMTWLLNMLTPTPKTRDGWWLIRATANYAENGCSSQSMGVWNSDGEPIATAMQSVALFG